MKKLLMALLCLICVNSFATNYYFSNSGSDANTGLIGNPWQTIAKFNSVFASRAPGDQMLFNRGDVFVGTLIISRSGSAGLPITIGAYGSGALPIITGFATVSAWTNLGSNIWESTSAVSTKTNCNMVVINGINTPMGRFPNSGWITAQTFSATSLTSISLNGAVTNWTGANVVVRKERYVINHNLITSASGFTLNYANDSYAGHPNWGFFIQNDVRTLDAQNEWYYNPTTKKIRIFSASSPTNVNVATRDTLAFISFKNYITFDNISFTGSNFNALYMVASHHINLQNCNFDFNYNAVYCEHQGGANLSTTNVFDALIINHSQNNGITVKGTDYTNIHVTNCLIKNSGMIPGMSGNGEGQGQGMNVGGTVSPGGLIQYNEVDSSGYIAIGYQGENYLILNNFVNYSNLIKDDGGGIYSGNDHTGNVWSDNTVLNTIGNGAGSSDPDPAAYAYYLDGNSCSGFSLLRNTAANFGTGDGKAGFFFHNPHDIIFNYNTAYNFRYCQWLVVNEQGGTTTDNMTWRGNIFFAKYASQFAVELYTVHDNIPSWPGSVDSNYYARPINDNLTINTKYGTTLTNRSLAMWKTFSGYDVNASKSPATITNVNQLDFQYNETASPVVKTLLPGNWIDVTGQNYSGTTTLQPYTSLILINTGTNVAPVANAGADKNITLPTQTITQAGSGTDADGTITNYNWTQASGPATATIVNPTSATTVINNLSVAGTYVFQLKVTDNQGSTGTDLVTVVVNASPPVNIPPVANAGGNKVIVLPTATVTQAGSGTDSDGTIVSYAWTKTTGPATFTIVSPTSATTDINNLIAGTYQFTLTVTDNNGATGFSTATIIVNAAPNLPPTANAGSDQAATWPTNTVTLSGSGTDPDGIIVSYAWSKFSGPASFGITGAGSSTANVTGLTPGVYQFQLLVTDNSGATAADLVTVTESQGTASLIFSAPTLTTIFNNLPQQPTLITTPAGLPTSLTLNGITGGQTNVGPYAAVGAITDNVHWISSPVTDVFTINKQTVVINAVNQQFNFDGLTHTIVATTTPSVPGLTHSYSSGSAPSALGVYTDTIRLVNSNYQATQVVRTITIVSNPAIIFISDSLKIYSGSQQGVTVTTLYTHTVTYRGILGTTYPISSTAPTNAGNYEVIATITQVGQSGADTATETISKVTGTFSWTQPGAIPFGAQLTTSILNATSNIPGFFTYSHVVGEIPPIGLLTIVATFHAADPANFNDSGTITRTISVFAVNPFLNYFITGIDGRIFFIEQ